MTDSDIAIRTVAVRVKQCCDVTVGQLNMLYGSIGNAKNPDDVNSIADGRSFIVSKLNDAGVLDRLETDLKILQVWSKNNI